MFAIGDFARHGRVSVRMLRHYDALGLLRPAQVDPASGYRSYRAGQLTALNRIVALKDLGFSLEEIRAMDGDPVDVEGMRGMLRLRRAELERTVAAGVERLARVEARLRALELDGALPAHEVVVEHLPATRLAALHATAESFHPEDIGPVVRPLCAELGSRLAHADVTPTGHLTCYYDRPHGPDGPVGVHAAVPVAGTPGPATNGLTVVDLPAAEHATLVHHGPIDAVLPAWQALARWIESAGRTPGEPAREVYLDCPEDPDAWVTELQEPLAAADITDITSATSTTDRVPPTTEELP